MVKDKEFDRRSVLKSTGCFIASTGIIAGQTTGRKTNNISFKLRGSKKNPVKTKNINKRRHEAFQEFNQSTDENTRGGLVGIEDKDDIIAYNFIATENGGVQEHFYTADLNEKELTVPVESNPSPGVETQAIESTTTVSSPQGKDLEERAHSAADSRNKAGSAPEISSGSGTVRTMDTSQPNFSTWHDRADLYHINEKPPYGIIIEQYTLKESPNRDDVFGVQTGVDIEAGENQAEHGDDDYKVPDSTFGHYHLRNAEVRHNWNTVISHDDSMRDRAPRGKLSNATQSFGVDLGIDSEGVGSAGFSYSYSSRADKIIDDSSMSDNIGRWELNVGSKSYASDNNAYYNPASLAILHPEDNETCEHYPWRDMKIVDLPLDATFALTSVGEYMYTIGSNESVSLSEDFFLPCP
mgnify:CR=1 FL=1